MKHLYSSFLSLCLLLTSATTTADLLNASVDYANGEYQKALSEFNALARLGNSDAMFNIAVMYLHGRGVEKNLNKAYAWFCMAGQFGIQDATNTAQYLEQQISDKQKLAQALTQVKTTINLPNYQATLAPIFNETFKPSQQIERSFSVDPSYPEHAIDKGVEGWVWLEFDIDPIGAVKNVEIIDSYPSNTFDRSMLHAIKRWRYHQSEQLPIKSRNVLYHFTTFKGKRYQRGFARQQRSYQKHIAEIIEHAENGHALWQYRIANWLSTDKHNASQLLQYHWQETEASQKLMLEAAKNGYPIAQYRIATHLLSGDKTQQDRRKGLNWLLLSAQNGYLHAQYRLGLELLVKQSVHYDKDKARLWLEQASDKGHSKAQLLLAEINLSDKQHELASQYLDSVLEKLPQNSDALYLKGKLLSQKNQPEEALSVLNKALSSAKSQAQATSHIESQINALVHRQSN